MGRKKGNKNFQIGDFVFAKLQGYCAWPAKIIACISKYKFKVYFYGTRNTANVKRHYIFMYAEKKQKFANAKTMKRIIFSKAIREIENAINGEDIADSASNGVGNYFSAFKDEEPPQEYSEAAHAYFGVADQSMNADDDLAESQPETSATKSMGIVTSMLKRTKPLNIVNNLLMVYLPKASCVGIKLYSNKPEFSNEEEEEEWMEQSRKDAMGLKIQLESGQVHMDSIMDLIVVEPTHIELSNADTDRFVDGLIEHKDALALEQEFMKLSLQLRGCLGVREANVDLCLELLDHYKEFEFNKLILLRNPESVDLIRRLRRYVGNLSSWKLSEIKEIEFKKQAEAIRKAAFEIYESIKKLFRANIPGARNFWEIFSDMVKIYKTSIKKEAAENASICWANGGGH